MIKKFTLVNVEVNEWNGFILSFIGIEVDSFEGELLGVHCSKDHFIFSVCFMQFTVASPFI